jgi:hypothetical protein
MWVGVHIDGFDLYYGARKLCGRGTPGWRWPDLRALAQTLVGARSDRPGAHVGRVVYRTARINAVGNPSGQADQDVYLKGLLTPGSVDHIGYGYYAGLAGVLQGQADVGVGRHSWRQLTAADFKGHQLPDRVGGYSRPSDW